MTGTYPIIIDGDTVGQLSVSLQGLMTVFEADVPDTGELLRLSVYGECEGYLGLMVPDGEGRQRLCRRLSRAALCCFPEAITHAGPAGGAVNKRPESGCMLEAEQVTEPEEPEPPSMPAPEPELQAERPCRSDGREDAEDLLWFSTPDGTLVSFDGKHSLMALPIGDQRLPEGTQGAPRRIEGKNYLVFQTKNGRII
jgi:hypothetical protein